MITTFKFTWTRLPFDSLRYYFFYNYKRQPLFHLSQHLQTRGFYRTLFLSLFSITSIFLRLYIKYMVIPSGQFSSNTYPFTNAVPEFTSLLSSAPLPPTLWREIGSDSLITASSPGLFPQKMRTRLSLIITFSNSLQFSRLLQQKTSISVRLCELHLLNVSLTLKCR